MLKEKLTADLKTAMKAGEAERVSVFRMVLSALHTQEIEKRAKGEELSEEEAMRILEKEAKKRREAAELYEKGGRKDLAEKELKEAVFIATYLPARATDAEIEAVVRTCREAGGADFATLMKSAMQELRGKAEGNKVGAVVKKILAE